MNFSTGLYKNGQTIILNDTHAEGTGVDIATNPVVPENVDASTLVLPAVTNDDVLPFEAVDTDAKVLAPPAVLEDRASLSSALSSANLSRVSIGNTSSTSSALVVLNVLPFKSTLAVSTVPDVLLFGFSSGTLGTLEVPLVALTSSALVVLKVRFFETVLAVSTVPVERPNDIHAEVTGLTLL